ncbi:MAG: TonB-dependent receptor [Gemmatimonadetes bacterium]|nr:TonB-dependent receptor [Gemmatimonadota bacterium]
MPAARLPAPARRATPAQAVILLLLLATLPAPTRVWAQGGVRQLHGVVQRAVPGGGFEGVDDAEVTAEWRVNGAEKRQVTRADERGRFTVRDLPVTTVRLTVRALGYAPTVRTVTLAEADRLVTITLAPASTVLAAVEVRDTVVEPLSRVTSTSTLDAKALAEVRGQTLGESIKHLPGVALIQFGPSVAKPVIRGLNSQRVLVMNAGIRQEDQQWGTEHAPNIDSFEADAVTVVRGAATVLYGADALGGVLRVDHAPVPTGGAVHGEVAANTFSNARQGAASAGVAGFTTRVPGVRGGVGYRARLTGRVAGTATTPDYAMANTGFREVNGALAVGATRGWGSTELLMTRFGTHLGVLSQAHAGNLDDLMRAMASAPRDSGFRYGVGRPDQRVSHTTARWRTVLALPRGRELEAVYGFQYNDRREYDAHGPLKLQDIPAFHLRLFTNSVDLRLTHPRWRGWRGTVGTSVQQQGNQTLGKGFLIPGYDRYQGALYAQEELGVGRFTLTSGVRGDLIRQTTLPFADVGIRSPAVTRQWQGLAGSVGAAYLLADGLDLSLRVAHAWRPPTVNELAAQGVHHGTAQYELGELSLGRERSSGVEGAVRYHGGWLELDLAAYENRIAGFIYQRPIAPVVTLRGAFPAFRYAATSARLRGVELLTVLTLPQSWSVQGTGTLVRGTDAGSGAPLFDMPADRLAVSVRKEGEGAGVGRWRVGGGVQLVRRQDRIPAGTVYALPAAGYGLLQLEGGTRGLRVGGRPLDLSVSVSNVTDRRYRDYLSRYRLFVNDAGRDVAVRLSFPF